MDNRMKVMLVTVLFVTSAMIMMPTDANSAESGFDVKDGQGTTHEYEEPSDMVMTIGKGVSATVIELGYLDKIIVCDNYTKTATEDVFDGLKAKIAAEEIVAGGNIYSSGKSQLMNDIIQETQDRGFDMEKDTIFLTGSATYLDSITADLESKGYKKILVWNDITTYGELADYVEAVSMVLSGQVHEMVEQMRYVVEHIDNTLEEEGIADSGKTKAFYVTYSGGVFKVGNTGSLATSMIQAAGGNAFTIDDSKAKPTYEESVTDIYEEGMAVFVDSSVVNNATNLANLQSKLPEVELVPLGSLWNNFAPDSMDGVWTMACAMYPQYFTGDVPTVPSDGGSDILLYAGAAVAIVAVIACIGFYFIRR